MSLAHTAAVFLGKEDIDNVTRPINMLKNVPPHKSIFRGEHVRFEFVTSKVVYDHLVTYSTANVRACAGLRANRAGSFVLPLEVVGTPDEDTIGTLGEYNLKMYSSLVLGIDPDTQDAKKKIRLQAARSVAPMSVSLHYILEFNFLTLMEAIFPQRIWSPGAQPDTREVVQKMWDLTYEKDPELWGEIKYIFGPESLEWQQARLKMDKKEGVTIEQMLLDLLPDQHTALLSPSIFPELRMKLKDYILGKYGKKKSMWD